MKKYVLTIFFFKKKEEFSTKIIKSRTCHYTGFRIIHFIDDVTIPFLLRFVILMKGMDTKKEAAKKQPLYDLWIWKNYFTSAPITLYFLSPATM